LFNYISIAKRLVATSGVAIGLTSIPQNRSGNINGNGTIRSGGVIGSGGIGPPTNMWGPLLTFNPIVELKKKL
jgi:hypothetical protein